MVEVEPLRVLLVEIGHEDFQGLVLLVAGTGHRSNIGDVENLGLRLLEVRVRLQLRASRRREQSVWLSQVQVPVVTVHLANHVGATVEKQLVHGANFIPPATVRAALTVRKEEVLAAVEHTVRSSSNAQTTRWSGLRESTKNRCNFKDARQTRQQSGGATGLQDQFVRPDEHAGLRQKVGVHVIR